MNPMHRNLMQRALPLVAIAACAAVAAAQHGGAHGPQRISPAPVAVEVPAAGLTLPMQDAGGRPVVDVRINGKGPYRFIFDTGASLTVIDAELKEILGAMRPGAQTQRRCLSMQVRRISSWLLRHQRWEKISTSA